MLCLNQAEPRLGQLWASGRDLKVPHPLTVSYSCLSERKLRCLVLSAPLAAQRGIRPLRTLNVRFPPIADTSAVAHSDVMAKSIEDIGNDYIAYARCRPHEEAPEQVQADALDLGFLVEDDPERAWEAIRYVVTRFPETELIRSYVEGDESEAQWVVGLLAAGPLEDFLGLYGPDYIERAETEARRDRRMAWALGGVWQWTMTDDVWARVQRAALQWEDAG